MDGLLKGLKTMCEMRREWERWREQTLIRETGKRESEGLKRAESWREIPRQAE